MTKCGTQATPGFWHFIYIYKQCAKFNILLVYHILSESNKTRQIYRTKHVVETCYKTLL